MSITFQAGNAKTIILDPGIRIVDDTINEAEQDFALLLELVDAVNPDRVDLRSERFITLARIFDNDRKRRNIYKGMYNRQYDKNINLHFLSISKRNIESDDSAIFNTCMMKVGDFCILIRTAMIIRARLK